ncbi:MAG TPA: YgiQ family radical SAM protein [Planctomycetes bacterium]|nr:YgiQ family radical SAM protein [Planctomycetota bacterium]
MSEAFLPSTVRDCTARGWPGIEVLLVTADPHVDHPSFGALLVGRYLEGRGARVGLVCQPGWRGPEDFLAAGRPALWCGIGGGSVDSILATYTVNRKLRRDDAFGPSGKGGVRPPRAVIVYANAARAALPGVPIVIGGVEAGTRRFAHYDWWDDAIRRSILLDARADIAVWGEGELAAWHITERLRQGADPLWGIPGTAVAAARRDLDAVLRAAARYCRVAGVAGGGPYPDLAPFPDDERPVITLPSFEEMAHGPRRLLIELTATVERETRGPCGAILVQPHGDRVVVSFPRARYLTTEELDAVAALPFTRRAHPERPAPPALPAIQASIITHRGCPGGCTFCAIGVHHGKTIRSRSIASVCDEARAIGRESFFRGTISDLGGPTANLYGMGCASPDREARCRRPACLWPEICPSFRLDAGPFRELLAQVRAIPGIAHAYVASGVRHDVLLRTPELLRDLVARHTGGRLKIAPEHAVDRVLDLMRKPHAAAFEAAARAFREECRAQGRAYRLTSYFIASFPGSRDEDMWAVKELLERLDMEVDQVQDFWPAPLTLAAAMYHAEEDLDGNPIFVAKSFADRRLQKACLRRHDPRNRPLLAKLGAALRKGRKKR